MVRCDRTLEKVNPPDPGVITRRWMPDRDPFTVLPEFGGCPPPPLRRLPHAAHGQDDPDRGPEGGEADRPARELPGDPEDPAVAPADPHGEIANLRWAVVAKRDELRQRRRQPVPTRRIRLQRVEEAVERLLESPLLLRARQAS